MRKLLKIEELNLSEDNLIHKSVHGGLDLLIGQVLSFLINIVSTMILARLLLPEDYGVFGMVIAFSGFLTIFRDFGLTTSLTQKLKTTNKEIITLFWTNIGIGLLFTLVLILLAKPISLFYDDTRLYNITLVLSLIFIIGSFSIVPFAILKRTFKFRKIVYIQFMSTIIGILVSILLAFLNFGYWALVANIVVTTILMSLGSFWALKWFPSFYYFRKTIISHLQFGKNIALFDMVNYFSRNLDNILIGKFFGAISLGLYSKSYQLMLLPITQIRGPISSISFPALASLQANPDEYNKYYQNLVSILSILTIPIVCFMWLNTYEIIYIVLGEKWLGAVDLFSLLSYVALVQPVFGTFGTVLVTTGQSKKYLYWGIINFLIISIGFMIGINYDLQIFILLYVIANYVSFLFTIPYVFKDTTVDIKEIMKGYLIPFIYFVFFSHFIFYWVDTNEAFDIKTLAIKTILFLITYIIFFLIFSKYRNMLLHVKKILKSKKAQL